MYATALRSDTSAASTSASARMEASGIRARGIIDISSSVRNGKSVRNQVHESGALRVRFPHEDVPGLGAVVVNTGGGMTGGDDFSIRAKAGPGSVLTVTTSAAEKIYRSIGPPANVHVCLEATERSSLAWLPQEAIVFDGARIKRRYDISMACDSALLVCDINCVGRAAMGETVGNLKLQDQWRIRIGGQLCYADFTRIDGHATNILQRATIADGAASFATLIYAGPEAEAACVYLRALVAASSQVQAGAGLFNGICVARFVSSELSQLREFICRATQGIYGATMPRSWAT
jgi:urease accessory protein